MVDAKTLMEMYRFELGEIRCIGDDEYCLFDQGLCIRNGKGEWFPLSKAEAPELHPSGMKHVVEYKVLIRPDDTEEISKGGVIIPPTVQAMAKNAMCKGTVELISDTAFTYFDSSAKSYGDVLEQYPHTPCVGDHVLFGLYAGGTWKGDDGVTYRIVNDKDVIAVIA